MNRVPTHVPTHVPAHVPSRVLAHGPSRGPSHALTHSPSRALTHSPSRALTVDVAVAAGEANRRVPHALTLRLATKNPVKALTKTAMERHRPAAEALSDGTVAVDATASVACVRALKVCRQLKHPVMRQRRTSCTTTHRRYRFVQHPSRTRRRTDCSRKRQR